MSDPAPNVNASPRRHGCAALLIAGFALALVLIGAAAGYWRYANYVPPYTPPLPTRPEPNGFEEALAAIGRMPRARIYGQYDIATDPPEKSRRILAEANAQLNEVRAAFELDWQGRPWLGPGDDEWFVAFRAISRCGQFFVAESRAAAAAGDEVAALSSALDAVELGIRAWSTSDVAGWIMATTTLMAGFKRIDQLELDLPATALRALLQRAVALRAAHPSLESLYSMDRISGRSVTTRYLSQLADEAPWEQVDTLRISDSDVPVTALIQAVLTPKRAAIEPLDKNAADAVTQARKPIRERIARPAPEGPWLRLLADNSTDELVFGGSLERFDTCLALLEVRLAVRMHFLETGAYPAALTDISPEWLPEIPLDIWEQPLQYRLVDGQPVVYSLGPDGVDDAGRALDPWHLDRNSKGDLVFGQLGRLKKAEQ